MKGHYILKLLPNVNLPYLGKYDFDFTYCYTGKNKVTNSELKDKIYYGLRKERDDSYSYLIAINDNPSNENYLEIQIDNGRNYDINETLFILKAMIDDGLITLNS